MEIDAIQKKMDEEQLYFSRVQLENDKLRNMYPSSQMEMFHQLMGRIKTLESRLATKKRVKLELDQAHCEGMELKGQLMDQDRDLSFYCWEHERPKR